ncbi:hypothetical protein SO802_034377 [Lithocarpus litseifolius]|uniref:Uncharacterized protein n=1 Tax=Lithocarpus litseifolius TaxID=425828 RepID=A0AAW2BGH8_9ROSI
MFFTTTTHEIFEDFVFKFYERPPPSKLYGKRTKRYCNACGKHVKGELIVEELENGTTNIFALKDLAAYSTSIEKKPWDR